MKILAVIPARAGSKGIPKKNVRLLNGKPLICYSIENAVRSKYITKIVVSTDDEEIKSLASNYDVIVIDRPEELCEDFVTLDSVIYHAYSTETEKSGVKYDYVITLQPTSPLLEVDTLDKAIEEHIRTEVDTTISGVNEPHLAWGESEFGVYPLYEKRVNRQYLPKHMKETGAFVITRAQCVTPQGRFGKKINIFATPSKQSIDIDTWQDWVLTEAQLQRKNILFRVDGYDSIGTGHIYRALLLAYNLTAHNVMFCLNKKSDIGIEKINNSFFKYFVIEDNYDIEKIVIEENIDIVVNDILDTSKEYIEFLKSLQVRVVNFEDLGEGKDCADAVINALYEKQPVGKNIYSGKDFYCLRDEFLIAAKGKFREQVKNVIVLFGGTDPCDLTNKVLDSIIGLGLRNIHYTFILGLGYQYSDSIEKKCKECGLDISVVKNVARMSEYMKEADLAVSSQGRTMFELAAMCVPTIVLSQNEREQLHEFGDLENGFLNLGLGNSVDVATIGLSIKWLIDTPYVRKCMYEKMKSMDLKMGTERVKKLILGE